MDKYQLSERDICTKFITPAIQQAGWQQHQFREEVNLTDGRVMVRGKLPPIGAREVTGEVKRLLRAVAGEMSRQQMQSMLGLKSEEHFRKAYLKPALAAQVIEMTLPEVPTSRLQRYRLTAIGRRWLEAHSGSGSA